MMAAAILQLVLVGGPDPVDELEALGVVIENALAKVSPSVVTIETVGGIRRVTVPERFRDKMTLPERPREDDRDAPEDDGGGKDEGSPEGRTPRFPNEFMKMLALPGFKKAEGPTTGLIISRDGYVITSAWNFDSKPNVVTVTTSDGKTHAARMLGVDRAAGLALVKIDAEDLPVPEFVEPKAVRIGAWAFAVGRAIGNDLTVKYGIISARNRIEGNALQTDAATNPTNYGGPLVDARGRVYGIIVPLGSRGQETNPNWYDSGIGFAAPVADPQRVVARLGKEGVVLKPAFLGVETDQNRTEPGAKVTKVLPDHGAMKAGLKKGDILLKIDGLEIRNGFTLRFEIGRRRAGDKVKLAVKRDDKELEVEATLGERPRPRRDEAKLPVPMPGDRDRKKKDRE